MTTWSEARDAAEVAERLCNPKDAIRKVAPAGGRLLSHCLTAGAIIPEARHEYAHAVAVLSGELVHHYHDGTTARLQPGQQVIIRPHDPHAWSTPDGCVFWCYSWHADGHPWSEE